MRTHLILDYLLEKDHGRCYICGQPVQATKPNWMSDSQWKLMMPSKDHEIPKSRGGGFQFLGMNNLRLTHAKCNSIKSSEPIIFFKMKQMMLNKFPCLEGQRLVFHYNKDGQLKSITHTP